MIMKELQIFIASFKESVLTGLTASAAFFVLWIAINYFRFRKNFEQEDVPDLESPEADTLKMDSLNIDSPILDPEETSPKIKETPKKKPPRKVIVRNYNSARPEDYITRDFQLQEFLSGDGVFPTRQEYKEILYLADQLQVVRTFVGCPITVNSGHRTKAHNIAIGSSATKSFHISAMAADAFTCLDQKEFARIFKSMMDSGMIDLGGLGIYNTHVHYDTRGVYVLFRGTLD